MSEMIACCGLICTKCPAYVATKNNDENAKERIAAAWSKHFGTEFKTADINCDGCLPANGRRSGYCRKICQIRPCATTRNAQNCAYCREYACEKLEKFFSIAPEAKETLDDIRKKTTN